MYTDDFVKWLEEGTRPATRAAYVQDMRAFARWFEQVSGQAFRPALLTAPDVREWQQHSLQVERVSAATWNRRLAALRAFTAWARQAGLLALDPLEGVSRQAEQELPPFWLDEREFRAVRRAMEWQVNAAQTASKRRQALRDRAVMALMLYAGLRVSEVCALDVDDLTLRERSGTVRVRDGKGGKAATLPLGREARLALRGWLDVRGDAPGALFASQRGGRITPRQVQRRVRALGQSAGVELWPHRLRHTFIRRLAVDKAGRQKYPADWVARLARHSRAQTTARYFAPSRDDLAAAVEGL